MGTSVVELIQAGAKRRQPTTADIVSLSTGSGSSPRSSKSSKSPRSRAKPSVSKSRSSTAKRPCEFGPRDANGQCPCKFGARVNGRCPKAPSRARNTGRSRTRVTARTTNSAAQQATDVVLNPKASREQKIEAVGKVAEVTATETAKTTVRKLVTPARIQQTKAAAKKAAAAAVPFALPIAASVAGGAVVSKLQKSRVSKQAKKMLDDAIRRTTPRARATFTPAVKEALLKQYEAEIRRRNEILFTK